MKQAFIVIFITLATLVSCVDFEEVSSVPEISYQSFTVSDVYDSSLGNWGKEGLLAFTFVDGDADLGVYSDVQENEALPDSERYGLFAELFEKVDGEYNRVYVTQLNCDSEQTDSCWYDTIVWHKHLPYDEKMDRQGQNKTIKGTVRASFIFYSEPPFDTMAFEFYIRDRALNKSNVEKTDDFTIENFRE